MCRITRSLKRLGVLIALVAFASTSLSGQGSPPRPVGKKEAPRTAQGKPDLQGVWDFHTITPMERPTELAGKATLTDEEAAKWEQDHQRNQDDRTPTPTAGP